MPAIKAGHRAEALAVTCCSAKAEQAREMRRRTLSRASAQGLSGSSVGIRVRVCELRTDSDPRLEQGQILAAIGTCRVHAGTARVTAAVMAQRLSRMLPAEPSELTGAERIWHADKFT